MNSFLSKPFVKPSSLQRKNISYGALLAFALPLTQAIKIQFIGIIYGADLAYPLVFAYLWHLKPKAVWPQELRITMILLGAWFVGALVADIFGTTSLENIVRGWSKIIMFSIVIGATYLLLEDSIRRVLILLAGQAFGSILEIVIDPTDVATADPWKFGIGGSITVLVLCAVVVFLQRNVIAQMLGVGIVAAISFASLALGVRSLFGETLIAAFFALAKIPLDTGTRRVSGRQFALVAFLGICVTQGSIVGYETAATNGWLGADAQDKFYAQSSDFGILLGGRIEALVAIQAISDSPLIGHGSWADDPYYVSMYADIREAAGISTASDILEKQIIPAHSHILGSWVEAGICGGVFWLWVLFLCVKGFYALTNTRSSAAILLAYVLVSLIWDVLFSPFGAFMRFVDGAKICAAIIIIRAEKRVSLTSLSPR